MAADKLQSGFARLTAHCDNKPMYRTVRERWQLSRLFATSCLAFLILFIRITVYDEAVNNESDIEREIEKEKYSSISRINAVCPR